MNNDKKSFAGGGAAWALLAFLVIVACVIITSPIWIKVVQQCPH